MQRNDGVRCDGGTVLAGTVRVSSPDDLARLASANSIDGDLLVTGLALEEFPDLSNLSIDTDDVVIAGNPHLTTLAALALTQVGGDYLVQSNDSLADLRDVDALERAKSLKITGNDGLDDLAGLEAFTNLSCPLTITNNSSLASPAGLDNVETASRTVAIRSNHVLENVDALAKLRTAQVFATSDVHFTRAAPLERLDIRARVGRRRSGRDRLRAGHFAGFPALLSVAGDFSITNNAAQHASAVSST